MIFLKILSYWYLQVLIMMEQNTSEIMRNTKKKWEHMNNEQDLDCYSSVLEL